MKKTSVATALVAALLMSCAGSIALFVLYLREQNRNEELTAQLESLKKEESRSAVMQSINAQMEEIADQERKVSDMEREKAIEQSKVAEAERKNAESQRRVAEEQRLNALLAERKAVEASDLALRQRSIAEQQRAEAETAKRVTDTLSYNALARSLGSLAVTQQTAGDGQLASLLACAAYNFTTRYKGDVYTPAVYQALSMASASIKKWNVCRGAVTKMAQLPGANAFLTVSSYGEIMRHEQTADNNLNTEAILQDNAFDFRDLVADADGTFYALSHTGHLVHGKPGSVTTTLVEGAEKPFRLFRLDTDRLLVVAERSIHIVDRKKMTQAKRLRLDFKACMAGESGQRLMLFDAMGRAYAMDYSTFEVKARQLPFVPQPVTSYAYNKSNAYEAFGTVEGTVFIADDKGAVQRLVGHRSRVSRVMFDADRLYSTSYDGTVRFWHFRQKKIEPMTIIDSRQWVVSFIFGQSMRRIWTGSQNGTIMQALIDPHLMADSVRRKLTRELTLEEWEYYIGRNVPYETLTK